MDWFKGKSTGNHRFSHEIWGFPVNCPLNQSIDITSLFFFTFADDLRFPLLQELGLDISEIIDPRRALLLFFFLVDARPGKHIYGLSMVNIWIISGWSMVNLWFIYGYSMVNLWFIYG